MNKINSTEQDNINDLLLEIQGLPPDTIRKLFNGINENTVMPFGKYKGKKLRYIPGKYPYWVLDQLRKFFSIYALFFEYLDDLGYLWDMCPDGYVGDGMRLDRDERGLTTLKSE